MEAPSGDFEDAVLDWESQWARELGFEKSAAGEASAGSPSSSAAVGDDAFAEMERMFAEPAAESGKQPVSGFERRTSSGQDKGQPLDLQFVRTGPDDPIVLKTTRMILSAGSVQQLIVSVCARFGGVEGGLKACEELVLTMGGACTEIHSLSQLQKGAKLQLWRRAELGGEEEGAASPDASNGTATQGGASPAKLAQDDNVAEMARTVQEARQQTAAFFDALVEGGLPTDESKAKAEAMAGGFVRAAATIVWEASAPEHYRLAMQLVEAAMNLDPYNQSTSALMDEGSDPEAWGGPALRVLAFVVLLQPSPGQGRLSRQHMLDSLLVRAQGRANELLEVGVVMMNESRDPRDLQRARDYLQAALRLLTEAEARSCDVGPALRRAHAELALLREAEQRMASPQARHGLGKLSVAISGGGASTARAGLRKLRGWGTRRGSLTGDLAPPTDVTVTVAEGSAGFKCDNKLGVTSVTPGGAADAAGVEIGMRLHAFQGAARPAQETRVLVWCSAHS